MVTRTFLLRLALFLASFASLSAAQDAAGPISRLSNCRSPELLAVAYQLKTALVDERWAKSPAQKNSPLPADYLQNLTNIANACENGTADVPTIRRDIELKVNDCAVFGMARLVPITVETLRASQVVSQWEVYYQWDSGSSLQTSEIRVPTLSTAKLSLPPGLYVFRAQNGQSVSDKVRVSISGMQQVLVQIKVP